MSAKSTGSEKDAHDAKTEDDVDSIQSDESLIEPITANDLISHAILSSGSTIPDNIIEFDYSFGYDCKKLYNLHLIDQNTLVFVSGNLIHFYNIASGKSVCRRSAGGSGIGALTINPNPKYNFLTIGENGNNPPIIIYKYPNMDLISYLRKGTTRSYSNMAYSTDGELLASQGGDPDYMITIWNWREETKILRTKSFSNDINTVMFSPYVHNQLATSGQGHIKFWKMSETFTGLKLQGEIGRFGKTDICDIIGIHPMPDEKVISGSQWGNILVWDEGLIRIEVCRKGRKPMHSKVITQLTLFKDEIMTTGLDGYVRIWFWPTVELADPPEDDLFVEIEPIYEYEIGDENHVCEIVSMIKRNKTTTDHKWYIQDGNGGIWLADISPESNNDKPKELFRCHAGGIVGLCTSPFSEHVVTLGEDGRLYVYDYYDKSIVHYKTFPAKGRALLWLPMNIEPTGSVLIAGFDDGVIRVIALNICQPKPDTDPITLIQIIKSHCKSITKLSINPTETILVSGSEDKTIFVHQLAHQDGLVKVKPIGLVNINAICTAINWVPNHFARILIGTDCGDIIETDLPERPRSYTDISYNLSHIEFRKMSFKSIKSELKRQKHMKEIEKQKKIKILAKMNDLVKMKSENPGINIDENEYLQDSESSEKIEPLFYPKIPNKILWLKCTKNNSILVSVAEYDAGYLYEYKFGEENPINCISIPDADDIEVNCYHEVENFTIFGMQDGIIRINRVNEDHCDLSDYFLLPMHDNSRGTITNLSFSFDKKYLFSVGTDGNLFSYKWNSKVLEKYPKTPTKFESLVTVPDIMDAEFLSLEQQKFKDDLDRRLQIAEEKKKRVLDILDEYRTEFKITQAQNNQLIPSQKITNKEMELDPRISEDLLKTLDEELSLVRRKLEYYVEKSKISQHKLRKFLLDPLDSIPITVEGIGNSERVKTFRIRKLTEEFYASLDDLEDRILKDIERKRIITLIKENELHDDDRKERKLEPFLEGLSASTIEFKLDSKMRRLLNKYRVRKLKEEDRKLKWQNINSIKPDPNINHPDDVKAIDEAENTIGDYKLKCDPMFLMNEGLADTTLKKYKELLEVREEIYYMRHDFNENVLKLRDKKKIFIESFHSQLRKLSIIQQEIPNHQKIFPKYAPSIDEDIEFPELKFLPEKTSSNELISRTTKRHSKDDTIEFQIMHEQFQRHILGITDMIANENFKDETSFLFERKKQSSLRSFILQDYKPLSSDDDVSPWELEQRQQRFIFNLFKQEHIVLNLNKSIDEFNHEVIKLKESRLVTNLNAKFLDIYLLTLCQELWILKDFEKLEDIKFDDLLRKTSKRTEIQVKILERKNQIEYSRRSIDNLIEDEKSIQQKFLNHCSNKKYSDFFRRIFKKKYKPPKQYASDDEQSSSSSSESSSTEDSADGASIDSMDIGNMRLDESTCPPGCDRQLYDLSFELRNQRHTIEQTIKNEQVKIEINRNEIDEFMKVIRTVEDEAEIMKHDLYAFRREKQKMLNKVETTVVLNMNKMQYFRDEQELTNVNEALLFNTENISKLYARVNHIDAETLETKRKHRINVIHLARMKTDCKFMENRIVTLKDEINETMMKKFGMVVSLDDLEEAILSKMVYDMRTNVDDVKIQYDHRINEEKKIKAQLEIEYNRVIQEGTEKLNILTILHEEQNYLNHIQEKVRTKKDSKSYNFKQDVSKLREISQQQKQQISILQREIQTLSMKSKPFEPIFPKSANSTIVDNVKSSNNEKEYQDSVITAIMESIPNLSTTNSPQNHEILTTVTKVVDKFILRNFQKYLQLTELNELRRRCHSIARYLTGAGIEIEGNLTDAMYEKLFENLQQFLPKRIQNKLELNKVRGLFGEIMKIIQKNENDTDLKELLQAIVQNAIENLKNKKTENFTHAVVVDIMKQMITSLPSADFKAPEIVETLGNDLLRLKSFNLKQMNSSKIINEVVKFSLDNYYDDIGMTLIASVVNSLHSIITTRKKEKEVTIDLQTE